MTTGDEGKSDLNRAPPATPAKNSVSIRTVILLVVFIVIPAIFITALYFWPNPVPQLVSLCDYINTSTSGMFCTVPTGPAGLSPGSVIRVSDPIDIHKPLPRQSAQLFIDRCLIKGASFTPPRFDPAQPGVSLALATFTAKVDKAFGMGFGLELPDEGGLQIKGGAKGNTVRSIHITPKNPRRLDLNEIEFLLAMNDRAILGDCLDYIRQEGFKLVTSIVVADAMDYQVETNDGASMDADAAIKDGRISLTGGPQGSGSIDSATILSWSTPNVMAADFATPEMMDKIRGRIPAVTKVVTATAGNGEVSTVVIGPSGQRVPFGKTAVRFGATKSIVHSMEVSETGLKQQLGLPAVVVNERPAALFGTATLSPAGAGGANLLFETNLTASSGSVVGHEDGAGGGASREVPLELASSGSLLGKIEIYKRFSGDDKLSVSIVPNRPSRPDADDKASIVVSDPDGRQLISVEKYDLRNLPSTGLVYDTVVKEPAVYTVSVTVTVDILSSTAAHSHDRSMTVSADLEPLPKPQVPPEKLR